MVIETVTVMKWFIVYLPSKKTFITKDQYRILLESLTFFLFPPFVLGK
jgi:hypothetical protein